MEQEVAKLDNSALPPKRPVKIEERTGMGDRSTVKQPA